MLVDVGKICVIYASLSFFLFFYNVSTFFQNKASQLVRARLEWSQSEACQLIQFWISHVLPLFEVKRRYQCVHKLWIHFGKSGLGIFPKFKCLTPKLICPFIDERYHCPVFYEVKCYSPSAWRAVFLFFPGQRGSMFPLTSASHLVNHLRQFNK